MITEAKTTLSDDTVRVEFNLNGLPNSGVHVAGFCGEDGSTVELYALVRIFQSDVQLMLL